MSNIQQRISPEEGGVGDTVFDDPKIAYINQRRTGAEGKSMASAPEIPEKEPQEKKSLDVHEGQGATAGDRQQSQKQDAEISRDFSAVDSRPQTQSDQSISSYDPAVTEQKKLQPQEHLPQGSQPSQETLDFAEIEKLVASHIQQKMIVENLEMQIRQEQAAFMASQTGQRGQSEMSIPQSGPFSQPEGEFFAAQPMPSQPQYTENMEGRREGPENTLTGRTGADEYRDYLLQIEELETASIEKILKEDIAAYSAMRHEQAYASQASSGLSDQGPVVRRQSNSLPDPVQAGGASISQASSLPVQKQFLGQGLKQPNAVSYAAAPRHLQGPVQQPPQLHHQPQSIPLQPVLAHGHEQKIAEASKTIAKTQPLPGHHTHSQNSFQTSDEPQENIKNLERWLEKPVQVKTGNPLLKIVVACLIVTGASLGGVSYFVYQDYIENRQTTAMPLDGFTDIAVPADQNQVSLKSYTPENVKIAGQTGAGSSTFGFQGGTASSSQNGASGAGASGSGTSGGEVKAALALPGVIGQGVDNACETPEIQFVPLNGGRTKIFISSLCHKDQKIEIKYGGVTFKQTANKEGQLEFLLDCFAGDKTPVEIVFEDGSQYVKAPITKDLDRLIKFAVIWSGDVNVDIHAFEYGADFGADGHIWEKQPYSYTKAYDQARRTGQGRGFISTLSNGNGNDKAVEVYTFLPFPSQKQDIIHLSLNYFKTAAGLAKAGCDTSGDDRMGYQTVKLVNNQNIEYSENVVAVKNCTSSYLNKASLTQNSETVQLRIGEP